MCAGETASRHLSVILRGNFDTWHPWILKVFARFIRSQFYFRPEMADVTAVELRTFRHQHT